MVKSSNHVIQVEPTFPEDTGACVVWCVLCGVYCMQKVSYVYRLCLPVYNCYVLSDPSQKLSLDLHLALISSDSWLHTPQHLALHNSGQYTQHCVIVLLIVNATS